MTLSSHFTSFLGFKCNSKPISPTKSFRTGPPHSHNPYSKGLDFLWIFVSPLSFWNWSYIFLIFFCIFLLPLMKFISSLKESVFLLCSTQSRTSVNVWMRLARLLCYKSASLRIKMEMHWKDIYPSFHWGAYCCLRILQ